MGQFITKLSIVSAAIILHFSPALSLSVVSYRPGSVPWRVSRLRIRQLGVGKRAEQFIAHGWQPVGVQHVKVHLNPGRTTHGHFSVGSQRMPAGEKFEPTRNAAPQQANCSFPSSRSISSRSSAGGISQLQAHWAGLLSKLQVHTPDIHTAIAWSTGMFASLWRHTTSRAPPHILNPALGGDGFSATQPGPARFGSLIPKQSQQRIR